MKKRPEKKKKTGFAFSEGDIEILKYFQICRLAKIDHLIALTGRYTQKRQVVRWNPV